MFKTVRVAVSRWYSGNLYYDPHFAYVCRLHGMSYEPDRHYHWTARHARRIVVHVKRHGAWYAGYMIMPLVVALVQHL